MELRADLFRPANYILTALRDVPEAMAIGGALVVLALILFLFNLRTAAISVLAIPLSLLTAVTVMRRLGFSLNIMVMGGLTTSTVLNLLVVPTLAPRWGRFTRPEPEEVG